MKTIYATAILVLLIEKSLNPEDTKKSFVMGNAIIQGDKIILAPIGPNPDGDFTHEFYLEELTKLNNPIYGQQI